LTGVTSYYVRADGSDANAGTSETAPFKTLAKAVQEAAGTPVKKITVMGTLIGQTDIKDSGADEILITGKADASGAEKALLKPRAEPQTEDNAETGIHVSGLSNIRLEHITITGYLLRGIFMNGSEQSILTVGQGAAISGNGGNEDLRINTGGGIAMNDGTLVIQSDAAITGNYAGDGGGIAVFGGTLLIRDEARITGNTADNEQEFHGGGGLLIVGVTATVGGNALIADNKARSGGGILVSEGGLILQDNAVVKGNTASVGSDSLLYGGGGIYSYMGEITLRGKAKVTGNSAAYGGGLYRKVSDLTLEEEGAISGNTATEKEPDIYENNA
jgi:hypothetical protein